jgi:RNA polymerase sigma-70 factor (ECF subfamily)
MASQLASIPAGSRPDGRSRAAELLAGVREGNARALQALVDLYWTPLVGFASGILRCEDAAEDVVQRAFIRFWERRDAWQPGSDPKLILYTVARNLALNQLESDRARVRRSAPRVPLPSIATPAQLLEEAELVRALESAIDLLSPRRREALVLARFHHMAHAEIAEVMGLAQRTVTNHITAALAELETALRRYLAEG